MTFASFSASPIAASEVRRFVLIENSLDAIAHRTMLASISEQISGIGLIVSVVTCGLMKGRTGIFVDLPRWLTVFSVSMVVESVEFDGNLFSGEISTKNFSVAATAQAL